MKGDSIKASVASGRPDAGFPAYVVITPARNEAEFIEQTAKSMARQTVPPVKWVVVSDGSTDGTDDIVKKYAEVYQWIELVRLPERTERHFAAKVYAFNAGYAKVRDLSYEIICNLDADVSFGPDHFEFLLGKFTSLPTLGVAGTAFIEGSCLKYDYTVVNIEDVQGQCQVFRRQCFEEIGGYVPIKNGGIDVVPVYLARMKGWQTRTFTERTYIHHRVSGTAQCSATLAYFKEGKKDSYLGVHPLWEVLRAVYNMKNRPYIAGGLLLLSGYIWQGVAGKDEPVPGELVAFRRKEQMQRLKVLFKKKVLRSSDALS